MTDIEPLLEAWGRNSQKAENRAMLLEGFRHPLGFPMPEGPVWIGHDDLETRDMEIADMRANKLHYGTMTLQDYAKDLENQRQERYKELGGGMDEYQPSRMFPCSGTLRVEHQYDTNNPPDWLVVRCTKCGTAFAIAASEVDPTRLVADRILLAGFPPQFLGKPMDTMPGQDEAKAFCRSWVKDWNAPDVVQDPALRLPAPCLYGPVGSGKSHLLVSTAEVIVRHHATETVYFSLRTLLDRVKEGFDTGDGRAWMRASTCELLVLDDVGAERPTDWAVDRFGELVDTRYQFNRPILMASNLEPDRWTDMFGARTASRMKGMVLPREMATPDQRVARRG